MMPASMAPKRATTRLPAILLALAAIAATTSLGSVGCGGVLYSARAASVDSKVENAKEMGAESLAPYYYYSAKERVAKAREEASRAEYGDALDLLDEAEANAEKAIEQAGAVRKGAGR
jgi:hypothetical protein